MKIKILSCILPVVILLSSFQPIYAELCPSNFDVSNATKDDAYWQSFKTPDEIPGGHWIKVSKPECWVSGDDNCRKEASPDFPVAMGALHLQAAVIIQSSDKTKLARVSCFYLGHGQKSNDPAKNPQMEIYKLGNFKTCEGSAWGLYSGEPGEYVVSIDHVGGTPNDCFEEVTDKHL